MHILQPLYASVRNPQVQKIDFAPISYAAASVVNFVRRSSNRNA
jgi:hypothetical protein